ncbi:MAG: DUF4417 domain-containing protein [Bacteroides sp.]|nr:DUF4417 domain-containing protein [Bacteroides sp.]
MKKTNSNIDCSPSIFSERELYLLSHDKDGNSYADKKLRRKQKSIQRYQNLHLLNGLRCSDEYGLPILDPIREIPDLRYVSFADRHKYQGSESLYAVHFFIDDYKFENLLNRKFDKTTFELCRFGAVFTPDFSVYSDIPTEFKKTIIFKRQMYAAYWQQRCGFNVIPGVAIPDAQLIEYALDGIPDNSVLAFCGVGHKKSRSANDLWLGGIHETIKRKKPKALIIYGAEEHLKGIEIPVIYISSHIYKLKKLRYE